MEPQDGEPLDGALLIEVEVPARDWAEAGGRGMEPEVENTCNFANTIIAS